MAEFNMDIHHANGDVTSVRANGIRAGVSGSGRLLLRFGSENAPGRSFVDVELPDEAATSLSAALGQAIAVMQLRPKAGPAPGSGGIILGGGS